MSNYQTSEREDNCGDCVRARLIEEAGFWARKGERTFWNWYQTLTTEQKKIVKAYMESIPE